MNLNLGLRRSDFPEAVQLGDQLFTTTLLDDICTFNNAHTELSELGSKLESLGVAYDNLCAIKEAIVKHGGATESLVALVGDSFNGTISVEATEEKKASVWERIKKFVVAIWRKIKELFVSFVFSANKLAIKLKEWIDRADKKTAVVKFATFKGLTATNLSGLEKVLSAIFAQTVVLIKTMDSNNFDSGYATKYPEALPRVEITFASTAAAIEYATQLSSTLKTLVTHKNGFDSQADAIIASIVKFKTDENADKQQKAIAAVTAMTKLTQKEFGIRLSLTIGSAAAFLAHNTITTSTTATTNKD